MLVPMAGKEVTVVIAQVNTILVQMYFSVNTSSIPSPKKVPKGFINCLLLPFDIGLVRGT